MSRATVLRWVTRGVSAGCVELRAELGEEEPIQRAALGPQAGEPEELAAALVEPVWEALDEHADAAIERVRYTLILVLDRGAEWDRRYEWRSPGRDCSSNPAQSAQQYRHTERLVDQVLALSREIRSGRADELDALRAELAAAREIQRELMQDRRRAMKATERLLTAATEREEIAAVSRAVRDDLAQEAAQRTELHRHLAHRMLPAVLAKLTGAPPPEVARDLRSVLGALPEDQTRALHAALPPAAQAALERLAAAADPGDAEQPAAE